MGSSTSATSCLPERDAQKGIFEVAVDRAVEPIGVADVYTFAKKRSIGNLQEGDTSSGRSLPSSAVDTVCSSFTLLQKERSGHVHWSGDFKDTAPPGCRMAREIEDISPTSTQGTSSYCLAVARTASAVAASAPSITSCCSPKRGDDQLEHRVAGLTPILPEGEQVEYYSRTHGRWIQGRLSVSITPGTIDYDTIALYTVRVRFQKNTQARKNVHVAGFRPLLTERDNLQVFSAGKWMPCRKDGRPNAAAAAKGRHRIYIEEAEGVEPHWVEGVPSVWLRRWFPVGTHVNVYMGPEAGWHAAVVLEPVSLPSTEDDDDDFGPSVQGALISTATVASVMSELDDDAAAFRDAPMDDLESVPEGGSLSSPDRVKATRGQRLGPASLGNTGYDAAGSMWYGVSVRDIEAGFASLVPSYMVYVDNAGCTP